MSAVLCDLNFCPAAADEFTALYAQVQSYIVLLNRQRVERTQSHSQRHSHSPPSTLYAQTHRQPTISDAPTLNAPIRARPLVINSCISIIKAFLFFHHRNPGALICWSLGQQAFNACMIILLDALESEDLSNEWLVGQAYAVFTQLEQNGVHRLAELAVQRISEGLWKLGEVGQRDAKRAAGWRESEQERCQQPRLTLDTASMMDWTATETVMGNTGTFLLEDHGLQAYHPSAQPFRPLSWAMAGTAVSAITTDTNKPYSAQAHSTQHSPLSPSSSTSANTATASTAPTAFYVQPVPPSPVSQVSAAPFPIMASPPFLAAKAGGPAIPVTNSPFAVGLQPRLTGCQGQSGQGFARQHLYSQQQQQQQRRRGQQQQGLEMEMGYHGLPTTSGGAGFAHHQPQGSFAPQGDMQQSSVDFSSPMGQRASRHESQSARSRNEASRFAGRSAQRRR